ncbi:MAG: hypothetical protein ACI89X_004306 [Planctomycetota bacterium]
MKFGDKNIMSCADPALVIATLQASVDVATLGQKKVNLAHLVGMRTQPPEVTVTATLTLLAKQPAWSRQATHAIVQATASPRASVRRAAYAALGTRDRELWACAWLAYEAALDPDPSVQSASPDAELVQESK